ncbi:MAG: putative PEP-binding protein [Salinispira sp.]
MSTPISFGCEKNSDALKHKDILGSRGIRAVFLAELDMPICPGFIITPEMAQAFVDTPKDMLDPTKKAITQIEKIMGKGYGHKNNLLLLKIVESPMLNIQSALPSIHHVGLTTDAVEAIAQITNEKFAYGEYAYLINCILKLNNIICDDTSETSRIAAYARALAKTRSKAGITRSIESFTDVLPEKFYTNPFFQLEYIIQQFHKAFQKSPTTNDSALMVQAMVYGNMQEKSASGYFYTHHIISGEHKLQGEFFPESYDEKSTKGRDISKLDEKNTKILKELARKLEHYYKELRWVRFAIEAEKLWLVDQSSVPNKSAQAEIKTLLDLLQEKVIDSRYIIKKVKPGRISEILHSVLDLNSVKKFDEQQGGIAGAIGASIGKVYFNAENLVTAYRQAQHAGDDTHMILAMPSTFAGDVKAIELAQGVLTSEGGYASHAPVVARSLGKVALVLPNAVFKKNSMVIGEQTIKEGDYLTMNVPYYEEPMLYIGKGALTKPVLEDSGLLEFLEVVQSHIGNMDVHANADQPRDAELAKKFNAHGIGLCRTEHMFFDESRINRFRYMIFTEDKKMRIKILDSLAKDQTQDFYRLFKIMDSFPVTIRLLDAPLHEFLPHGKTAMQNFVKQAKTDGVGLTPAAIAERTELLDEFNPMLGHRGVRIAMSYPEIYQMQIKSIFEAAYKLKKEGKYPRPEIMIPLIMNKHELKVMRNGKRMEGKTILSIAEIEETVRKKYKSGKLDYLVGTMIELPAAALDASEISKYADFFSFGTNDLTQTTYGLSRDDFNTFFSDYTELDLLPDNPFQVLQPQIQSLIGIATLRGRMTRPDLKLGLCGEHGAEPRNIDFIAETGLDYVSVSPYGIPIAKLAIAQMNLKNEGKD